MSTIPMMALANALHLDALRTAMSAVIHLDDAGCTVRKIDIHSRHPLIRIDPPPAGHSLHGAVRRRITEHGITRTVCVALLHGALVEWEVRTYPVPRACRVGLTPAGGAA